MTLIFFLNKCLQKSWSVIRFKKLRCRGILLNDLPAILFCKIHSVMKHIFREQCMLPGSGLGTREGAEDNPGHSLASRNLLHRIRASQYPWWDGNRSLARWRGSEILNKLIVSCSDKWFEEENSRVKEQRMTEMVFLNREAWEGLSGEWHVSRDLWEVSPQGLILLFILHSWLIG